MTAVLDRQPPSASASSSPSAHRGWNGSRLPFGPRGRKPLLAVASVLLILVSIAAFATVYSSADHRVPVLMVTSAIQQGQRISATDLGTADVASSGGLSLIPVSRAAELTGRWAAVTIPAGALLTAGDVTASRSLAEGAAVVGLALKDGQLPSTGVAPGDQVMIVQTLGAGSILPASSNPGGATTQDGTGAVMTSTGVLVAQATVFETATPSASSSSGITQLVSVVVPSTVAAAVSTASAASQVSVVLLPAGPTGPSRASSSP